MIEEKYKGIYLKTLIYLLDEEGFEKCKEIDKNSPEITDTMIEKYEIKQETVMKILEGKIYRIK